MEYSKLIDNLAQNRLVFQSLLENQEQEAYLFRPNPTHWCLLEIVCHLYDEEREDFRQRLKITLEHPGKLPPSIDPVGWVKDRKYIDRNYPIMVQKFLDERKESIQWLHSLQNPQWTNAYKHSQLGQVSAHHFISNWLAHDYLHIRQITRVKYNYLKFITKEPLHYAGDW